MGKKLALALTLVIAMILVVPLVAATADTPLVAATADTPTDIAVTPAALDIPAADGAHITDLVRQLAEELGLTPDAASCVAMDGPCSGCFDCYPTDMFWEGDVLTIFWDCECQGGAHVYRITDSEGTNFCAPY